MSTRLEERDALLAMAYADGELRGTEREAFERRLAGEPLLAAEVAAQQRLAVLARNSSPLDPELAAWRARENSPFARRLRVAAVVLLLAGICAMFGFMHLVLTSEYSRVPRWLAYLFEAGLAGFLYLVWRTVKARLATRHLDPYRDLER